MLQLLLFPIIVQSPPNPILTNEYQIVVEAPPPELTLQEKIDQNINQCVEATQWISAEDASCITKPIKKPVSKPVVSHTVGSSGLNGYVLNSCTGWVATHRYVPSGWGNATNWKNSALKAGWTVSSTPVAGAIGWVSGHVVYVESVGDGVVNISERNYDYRGSVRQITVPTSKYTYLY